jgi:hypothetical protein
MGIETMKRQQPSAIERAVNLGEMSVEQAIIAAWNAESAVMDWAGFETVLAAALKAPTDNATKVARAMETLDAFTRRGHFALEEYPALPVDRAFCG